MKCPYCGSQSQKVLDSRPARNDRAIRRRRACDHCKRRFTTFESVERAKQFVIKRDRSREEFQREKLLNSLVIACRKRPISIHVLLEATDRMEASLYEGAQEVTSAAIGEAALQELQSLDVVAHVRFASVYKEFDIVDDFEEIVQAVSAVQKGAGA